MGRRAGRARTTCEPEPPQARWTAPRSRRRRRRAVRRLRAGSRRAWQPGTRGRAGRGAPARGVGGEQVEGRQAVRELLLAGTRKVHEIWISGDADRARSSTTSSSSRVERACRCTRSRRRSSRARRAARRPRACSPRPRRCRRPSSRRSPAHGQGSAPPFLIACDGVTDPGNLGALLRSAECAGATGVVLPRHRAAHVTPDGDQGRRRRRRAPAGLPSSAASPLRSPGSASSGSGWSGSTRPVPAPCLRAARRPTARSRWCSVPRAGACRASSASAATRWSPSRSGAVWRPSTWPSAAAIACFEVARRRSV